MGSAGRKVRGGKYLRVLVEHDGSVITTVRITGDFFLHPEDKLYLLEEGLGGTSINESERSMAMHIEVILSENRLSVLGFQPADLASVIKEALT